MRWRGFLSALLILSALATPAAAQAPTPATTAFDGRYIGTATPGRDVGACASITSMDKTITGGQVVVHESHIRGRIVTYQGSVNAVGGVSAIHEKT